MKAVAYMRPGLEMINIPEPQPVGDDYVKIKIAYAGICGTDAHILKGHFDPMIPPGPFTLGHESSGVIVELGPKANVKGLKVGDKVSYYYNYHCGKCHFCRNGQENLCTHIEFNMSSMCEYICVTEQQVYKLPESISLLQGALAEPASFCMRSVDQAKVIPGKTVVISGGGAIGLMTLQIAKLAGGSKITVIEPVAKKREIALSLGATHVIDPINENLQERVSEITKGIGYDCVIECSGARPTIQSMLDIASPGANVVYAAMYGDAAVEANLWMLFAKEINITAPHQSPYCWERTMNILPDLNLDIFNQCVYPIEQCEEAFAEQKTSIHTKVIIKIDEDAE
ncbi:zinc-dependent alcohol dehydrogenase family protein [Clostridium sediminicola]|uniref:zinc-dependent alcohol dehydrogenase n=1 Tax=Clostridium sediminicola TaxID=3114879 RepID=UPI0031F20B72